MYLICFRADWHFVINHPTKGPSWSNYFEINRFFFVVFHKLAIRTCAAVLFDRWSFFLQEGSWSMPDFHQVHERQTARMRTRSEWFLTPVGERLVATDSDPTAMHILRGSNRSSSGNIGEHLLMLFNKNNRRCLDVRYIWLWLLLRILLIDVYVYVIYIHIFYL